MAEYDVAIYIYILAKNPSKPDPTGDPERNKHNKHSVDTRMRCVVRSAEPHLGIFGVPAVVDAPTSIAAQAQESFITCETQAARAHPAFYHKVLPRTG